MQFIVIGLDGTDEQAMDRRMAARQAHIQLGEELKQAGNLWFGAALLSDSGQMNGSMYLLDFKTEEELQAWLAKEPYVKGEVWKQIEIRRASVRDPWQFSQPREFYEARIAKD